MQLDGCMAKMRRHLSFMKIACWDNCFNPWADQFEKQITFLNFYNDCW